MDYEPIRLSLSDWEVLLQVWDVSDNTAYQLPIKPLVKSSSAVSKLNLKPDKFSFKFIDEWVARVRKIKR